MARGAGDLRNEAIFNAHADRDAYHGITARGMPYLPVGEARARRGARQMDRDEHFEMAGPLAGVRVFDLTGGVAEGGRINFTLLRIDRVQMT